MKFIQTRLGYVEDAHIYVDRFVELHLEFTHFYGYQIFWKDTSTEKIWFRDHCAVSFVPMRQKSHVDVIAHILHSFTEYRVVH